MNEERYTQAKQSALAKHVTCVIKIKESEDRSWVAKYQKQNSNTATVIILHLWRHSLPYGIVFKKSNICYWQICVLYIVSSLMYCFPFTCDKNCIIFFYLYIKNCIYLSTCLSPVKNIVYFYYKYGKC